MVMNRIQLLQPGFSLPARPAQFGSETQCEVVLELLRWSEGFRCPTCNQSDYYLLKIGKHNTLQCKPYRSQVSLIADTLFHSIRLLLTLWFLAVHMISEAKTGLSALTLKRHTQARYPSIWFIQQKLMQAMAKRDAQYTLAFTLNLCSCAALLPPSLLSRLLSSVFVKPRVLYYQETEVQHYILYPYFHVASAKLH